MVVTGRLEPNLSNSKKIGGNPRQDGTFRDINNLVETCDMLDLKHIGNKFSWSGQRSVLRNGVQVRELVQCCLDRAMANSEWFSVYPASTSEFLEPIESDHRPVIVDMLTETPVRRGQFYYDKRLFERERFEDAIKTEWRKQSSRTRLLLRLKRLRCCISKWKRQNHTNTAAEITRWKEKLEDAFTKPNPDFSSIKEIKQNLSQAYYREEVY